MKEAGICKAQGGRLAMARMLAGFKSARQAALANGWPESTYRAHEGGTRTIGHDDAERYAKRFRHLNVNVTARSILFEDGASLESHSRAIPIVGYVSAGAGMVLLEEGHPPNEWVGAIEGATGNTVAVEVRGASLGELFDNWIVYYDDVRSPVTVDLLNKLCVIGLYDGRVVVKKLRKGRQSGRFDLHSNTDHAIYGVKVKWAARVKQMTPR